MISGNPLKQRFTILFFSFFITACGGGGSDDSTPDNSTTQTARLVVLLDSPTPIIGASYSNSSKSITGVTESDGSFKYKIGETTLFSIAGKDYSINPAQNDNDILASLINPDTKENLKLILLHLDNDTIPNNGIDLTGVDTAIDADLPFKTVLQLLFKETGDMPSLTFKPSLGINTEAPQGGADTAGMPMPFVDIFRTARPFPELSPLGTTFDQNGWPSLLNPAFGYARTKLLQGTLNNAIPEGKYTVLYEGAGTLEFGSSGAVTDILKVNGENKYTFSLNLQSVDSEDEVAAADTNAFNMNIKNISGANYIRNIRIVMPGGTCTGNPFIHVQSQAACPNGTVYESFTERLQKDRNTIIFNPDYLLFLRNFKVVRMMNLMEASLK